MGTTAKPLEDLASRTRYIYELLQRREPSPRVRQAMRLYATAAVPTKAAAADAVGLSRSALYNDSMPSLGDTPTRRLFDQVDEALADRTINMSRVLAMLSREAIGKISNLMRYSESEQIQLKAAVDLADRAPDTSKTQKIAAVGVTLSGKDVHELAAVMAESAQAQEDFNEIGQDDYVTTSVDEEAALPHHAERQLRVAQANSNAPST